MKATTIEQSRKLIELGLNTETADLYWWKYENKTYLSEMDDGEFNTHTDTPAWSLSALLGLIPNGTRFMLMKHNENFAYFGINASSDNMQIRECDLYNDLISMVLDKFIYPMLKNKQIK